MSLILPSEMTLLEALSHFFPDSSKRTLSNWINHGRILVSGQTLLRKDTLLSAGQELAFKPKEKKRVKGKFEIVYEDRYMIVIDKMEGCLSVATDSKKENDALFFLRQAYGSTVYPVHRLDRETSGILLFARGGESQKRFDLLFETHTIDRRYFAILEGRLPDNQGTWESYLIENPNNFDVSSTTSDAGKKAITHYKVLHRSKKFTYVELELETGRKHQIRVQASDQGHPVVGDKRYGATIDAMDRVALHAIHLGFIHPFTGKKMSFSSPLPQVFDVLGARNIK